MYYRESDTIVANCNFAAEDIAAVDEYLFRNQENPVRVKNASAFLSLDEAIVEAILGTYSGQGVVAESKLAVCRSDDALVEEADVQGNFVCDLCDRSYSPDKVAMETDFVPRACDSDSGDIIIGNMADRAPVEGVNPVAGCDNRHRELDVVFVHGLGGDAFETWMIDAQPESFWPKWVHEQLPEVGVWTIAYEAEKTKWTGDALALPDRATDVLDRLQLAGIGDRPIVFVVHSLGGLVIKQALRNASSFKDDDFTSICEQTRGIVFLATPHAGSDLSTYMDYVRAFARATPATEDLQANSRRLHELNTWFRANFSDMNLKLVVMYETKPTKQFGLGKLVVDQTSADPGIARVTPRPVETDHISICKPQSRSSAVVLRTVRLIQDVMG